MYRRLCSLRRLGVSSLMRRRASSDATVLVEGNIASGKTNCLAHCASLADVEVVEEPVDLWRNCGGHNLLDLFYKDPCRNGLAFQLKVLQTRLDSHTQPATKPVRLLERSVFSWRYCFLEALAAIDSPMPPAQVAVLSDWFDWHNRDLPVTKIIYLRTTPDEAFARLRKRSRAEEATVSLEYLTKLHNLHDDWLIGGKFPLPCPVEHVEVVDANQSFARLKEVYEGIVRDLQPIPVESQRRLQIPM